ncbi:MAG: CARDB domain-containing protein [Candidatus Heimdallarchaeaceae archaeon]
MKNIKIYSVFIIFLFIFSSSKLSIIETTNIVIAGSSSSGDIPPPGGSGGDTGGGGAAGGLYLNYRIPLIFRSGSYGPSLIVINSIQNDTLLIFEFNSTRFPDYTARINVGETLILDPSEIPELRNGSLIQAFTPLQITVFHQSNSPGFDDTYSYSPLAMQMWGRIYQSVYDDMRAIIVAGYNNTEIEIRTPGEETEYIDISLIGQTTNVSVSKGTIIEANGPIGVVFYSLSNTTGSFALTGIPLFLWGTEYFVYSRPSTDSIPLLEGDMELSLSAVGLGEKIHAVTNLHVDHLIDIPDNGSVLALNSNLDPGEYYHNFKSIATDFSVTSLYNYVYDGVAHKSAVGYISVDNMKYAELFYTKFAYNNSELKSVILTDAKPVIPLIILGMDIYADIGNSVELNEGDFFSYSGYEYLGVLGNGSLYSFVETSVPESTDWNSSTNILYPLNLFSIFDNTSTYFPSWYRFPNINVKEVVISPTSPTEFRRLQLDIFVQNNGSIPSAPFWVTVYVNDSLKINTKLDGIDINQSIPVTYEEFQSFGLKILNVSIFTDSQNQILELAEFDNSLEFFIEIIRNWNIIYTGIALAVAVVGILIYIISRRIIKQRRKNKSHFDVILSDIEV